ncbi:hypothetical protein ABZY58_11395 [Micromonospora tulbaghiae]|uniref:hypothetical protein n=1 Tax=Micromonospora tulbaghiae TaxID=479978 RepID=UPI0033AB3BFC
MSVLTEDLESLRRTARVVSTLAWGVAGTIMIYGIPIVYRFLVHHDVPKQTAWLLSLAVDGALAVGLIATPILARYDIKGGWIGALRWIAGFATWALNTSESWIKPGGPDLGGVFSHSWGPLMMFFAVEGAAYFQRKIAEVIRRLEREQEEKDTARKREAASRADEIRRLTDRAAAAEQKLAETNRKLDETNRKAAEAEKRAEAEAEARAAAEQKAEEDRKRTEAEAEVQAEVSAQQRKREAEVWAEQKRNLEAEVQLLTNRLADASERYRVAVDEAKNTTRGALEEAAQQSDLASRTLGQLEEARLSAERATADKAAADQQIAALQQAHAALSDELARVSQAHARLARRLEETERKSGSEVPTSGRRRPGSASVPGSTRKRIGSRSEVPALPLPANNPTLNGFRPETVAAVLDAYRKEPAASRARAAELSGVSTKTVANVMHAVEAHQRRELPASPEPEPETHEEDHAGARPVAHAG